MTDCTLFHSRLAVHQMEPVVPLSPISAIPVELLIEILEPVSHRDWYDRPLVKRPGTFSLSPISLGLVCRRWHEVIQTTPTFWSNISLVLTGAKRALGHKRVLRYYLKRSNSHPLKIQIRQQLPHGNANADDDYRYQFTELMRILAYQSHRWKHVSLHVPVFDRTCQHFLSIKGCLPILQTLSIQSGSVSFSNTHQLTDPLDMFSNAPRLTKVHYPPAYKKLKLNINWSTVTSLTCSSMAFKDAVRILREAANLRECDLSVFYYPVEAEQGQSFISHPALETLTLRENSCSSRFPLLDLLILPNLSLLSLNASARATPSIDALLLRSGCSPIIEVDDLRYESVKKHLQRTIADYRKGL